MVLLPADIETFYAVAARIDGTAYQRQLIARNKPSAFACPTATGTADLNTWSFQGGYCDCAVSKLHKTYFKLGMFLTGPKIDVKSKKKAFIYRTVLLNCDVP
jgi:hypothetical protein